MNGERAKNKQEPYNTQKNDILNNKISFLIEIKKCHDSR